VETDPLGIASRVIDVLDRIGARYSIGGSMASAFADEPRSTLDVDIVVALTSAQADALAQSLGADFYLDRDRLQHAVTARTSANLIHIESSIKIDLFVSGGTALDDALLRRRRSVIAGEAGREFFVHSPEDILLQKLRRFRLGGETSDRQWRDVLGNRVGARHATGSGVPLAGRLHARRPGFARAGAQLMTVTTSTCVRSLDSSGPA
jgi:hypothetical protein